MYCKNCGRQLKEGMRFCDRCGHSVRKSQQSSQSAKRQEIEELKTERLNRKKRLAEQEAKQFAKKKRKKKSGNTFAFLIVIVLIAIVSIIIGYNIFPNNGNVSQPSATNTATAAPAVSPSATATSAKAGYTMLTIGNITCPYPSDFHSNTVTAGEKLNATDPLGGAVMIVAQEGKGGVPKDMMMEYASLGSNVSYSRAGDDWYAITLELDGKINHRKCIVRNGISVYYDFTYDATSSSVKRYQDYISYIDSNFK